MPTQNSSNYLPIQYDVLTGGANGTINNVSPSTSGFVLTDNGVSAQPTFQAAPANNLVLIQSQTPSAVGNIVFTSGITSTYNNYLLIVSNFTMSASTTLLLQVSSDGGSTYKTSGYFSGFNSYPYNSATGTNVNSTSGLLLASPASTGLNLAGEYLLSNLTSGSNFVMCSYGPVPVNAATLIMCIGSGVYGTAITVNALKLIVGSGTMTGIVTLFGILH